MQEHSKGADPYPAMDSLIAGSVNNSWPDNHTRDPKLLSIMCDYFLLFEFCEAISFPAKLGSCLDRTRLIQHPPVRLVRVGIYRERTDVDEPLQAFVLYACF